MAVAADATTQPAAPPTTRSASFDAIDLGFVLMEVNSVPIYSDKVLNALERVLEAEARKNPREKFKEIAAAFLTNQVNLYKRDELEYASAQKSLEPADEALARQLTIQWRQKQITEAGGSVEMAKRKAIADGNDFDKLVERQSRLFLIQIFYQKRVIPLIQVNAADLRNYYNAHQEAEFSTHPQARFRVIKVNPRKFNGLREEAYAKIQQLKKRSATEDFTELAKSDDNDLAASAGLVGRDGWVENGAYRVKEVEAAALKLQPGEVSDIIQADQAFFLVKLEEIQRGTLEPFDKLEVQDRIREKLRAEQFQVLREKHVAELEKGAVTRRNDGMMQAALDIIMRRYNDWAGVKEADTHPETK